MKVVFKNIGCGQMMPIQFDAANPFRGDGYVSIDIPDGEAEKLKAFYELHKSKTDEYMRKHFTPINGLISIEVLSENAGIGKVIAISKNAIESANHKSIKVGAVVRLKSHYVTSGRVGDIKYIKVGDIAGVMEE